MRTLTDQAVILLALCALSGGASADEAPGKFNAAGQVIARAGTLAPYPGPAANFTGQVRVDPLTQANGTISAAAAFVTFAPGARSAWHTHPAGQYLIVTTGKGLTQQWGKPIQELRVGDVAWCPPNVKHWHGAAPDSAMTHIAMTGNAGGKSVNWMEKVSDANYAQR
jgi:quercetin dioxygenase-like cupin family protein